MLYDNLFSFLLFWLVRLEGLTDVSGTMIYMIIQEKSKKKVSDFPEVIWSVAFEK